MHRRTFLTTAACFAFGALGLPGLAHAKTDMTISGPYAHENLAVYFLHGDKGTGPVPLTLQEALTKGSVQLLETGQVSELTVENTGVEEVFIQAGDIVKGGRQDRVLTVSLVLPPQSGKVPISSFCVEQGRWSARGREDAKRFASSAQTLPSREAKLVLKEAAAYDSSARRSAGLSNQAPEPRSAATGRPAPMKQMPPDATDNVASPVQQRSSLGAMPRDGQSEIWNKVAETQRKLSENMRAAVASPQSATSLQLSLENQKLKETQSSFIAALKAKGEEKDDVVGVVIAVNGRLSSAEVYPSNGLFRKMWEKLLIASTTEAIGESKAKSEPAPAIDAVKAFLADAETGKAVERTLPAKAKLETRANEKALYSAAYSAAGIAVHRSYVAK